MSSISGTGMTWLQAAASGEPARVTAIRMASLARAICAASMISGDWPVKENSTSAVRASATLADITCWCGSE